MSAAVATHDLPLDLRVVQTATRWIAWSALAVLLLMVAAWLLRQPWWVLTRIRLEGDLNRSNVATIRANALPQLRGNFFTIDLQETRRAFEAVPWVRQAEVRRVWPGELRVHLQEHRAVALWEEIDPQERRDDRLVGSDGAVFQANTGDVEDDNLPLFRGPRGTAALMLQAYGRLSQALAPVGRLAGGRGPAQIRTLQLTTKGLWSAELDTGGQITFGRGSLEELVQRTDRFARTVTQATQTYRRPLVSADLRHADGYALHLSGVTTVPSATGTATPPQTARSPRTQP